MKKKKNVHFYPSSFNYRFSNALDIKKSCDILNELTEEQIRAVELYGASRYDDGYNDGYNDIRV
jgi:hypothetical protein